MGTVSEHLFLKTVMYMATDRFENKYIAFCCLLPYILVNEQMKAIFCIHFVIASLMDVSHIFHDFKNQ